MTDRSPLQITRVAPASADEWLEVCRADNTATFFHSPLWAEIFSKYHGRALVPCGRRIEFSDGATAVIPLTRARRLGGAITMHHSTSPGTYGGWVAPAILDKEHAALLIAHLSTIPNICWYENPFGASAQVDIPCSLDRFTQVIDLRRSMDEIHAGADRAHHKALHKAEREGITVRLAESEADWNSYYNLYLDSLRRWRFAEKKSNIVYSKELFRILREHQGENIRLWMAEKNGRAAAGIVSLYWNHHAVTWHGAAHTDFLPLRPNNMLYWEVLRDAHRRGFWWFDCNPSGGNPGVETFKAYLGAQRMRSRFIDRRNNMLKCLIAMNSLASAFFDRGKQAQ
jgi:hypothetical protein